MNKNTLRLRPYLVPFPVTLASLLSVSCAGSTQAPPRSGADCAVSVKDEPRIAPDQPARAAWLDLARSLSALDGTARGVVTTSRLVAVGATAELETSRIAGDSCSVVIREHCAVPLATLAGTTTDGANVVLHAPGDAIVVTLESRTSVEAALTRTVSKRSDCVLPTPAPASAAAIAEAVRRLAGGAP